VPLRTVRRAESLVSLDGVAVRLEGSPPTGGFVLTNDGLGNGVPARTQTSHSCLLVLVCRAVELNADLVVPCGWPA